MKISSVSPEALYALPVVQKWDIVCGNIRDDGATAPVALLLGTAPSGAILRAKAAADLFQAGCVSYIVPSGGVLWEHEGEQISEADLMARVLRESGVPEEAIICEREARTTKENMICGTLQINRRLSFAKIDRVIIVTSVEHMRRSIALAKTYLPRKVKVFAYPAPLPCPKEEWLCEKGNVEKLNKEMRLLQKLVKEHYTEDFEID